MKKVMIPVHLYEVVDSPALTIVVPLYYVQTLEDACECYKPSAVKPSLYASLVNQIKPFVRPLIKKEEIKDVLKLMLRFLTWLFLS